MNMRGTGRIVAGVVTAFVLLSGCGSGEEVLDATTTTAAAPAGPVCTGEAARTGTGVEMILVGDCVDGWAVAVDAAYAAECGDCESQLLLRWQEAAWKVAYNCNAYAPLSEGSCVTAKASADWPIAVAIAPGFPDLDTACRIWDANTQPEFVVSAGCFGDADDLRYDDIPPCPTPLQRESEVPIRICQKGATIRAVQRALKDHGASLSVDGEFGPGTLEALIDYQKEIGLPVTGVIDDDVLINLGLAEIPEGDY